MGHRGLGEDPTYPVSATVLEPGQVCYISMDFFHATLKVNPGLAIKLLLFFADELRESRAASVESITASDGTTTWNIFADAASVAGPVAGGGDALSDASYASTFFSNRFGSGVAPACCARAVAPSASADKVTNATARKRRIGMLKDTKVR